MIELNLTAMAGALFNEINYILGAVLTFVGGLLDGVLGSLPL